MKKLKPCFLTGDFFIGHSSFLEKTNKPNCKYMS